MKVYCVVTEFYDNGRVSAWITNHIMNEVPESRFKEYPNKDVYCDYFTDKDEAIKFCDEAKEA